MAHDCYLFSEAAAAEKKWGNERSDMSRNNGVDQLGINSSSCVDELVGRIV